MPRYDTVLFDLDGTLTDSIPLIAAGVRHTAQKLGYGPLSEEQIRKFIGPTLHNGFKAVMGLEGAENDQAVAIYRQFYQPQMTQVPLYEGVEELLGQLHAHGVQMAVASAKLESSVQAVVKALRIDHFFQVASGTIDHKSVPSPVLPPVCDPVLPTIDRARPPAGLGKTERKDQESPGTALGKTETRDTKAAVIAHALSQISYRQAVMIGDRQDDYLGAKANQIPAIGVQWGAGDASEFPGCPYVSSFAQLSALLLGETEK